MVANANIMSQKWIHIDIVAFEKPPVHARAQDVHAVRMPNAGRSVKLSLNTRNVGSLHRFLVLLQGKFASLRFEFDVEAFGQRKYANGTA